MIKVSAHRTGGHPGGGAQPLTLLLHCLLALLAPGKDLFTFVVNMCLVTHPGCTWHEHSLKVIEDFICPGGHWVTSVYNSTWHTVGTQ